MLKRCFKCRKKKETNLFYRDIQKSDGLTSFCRDCVRRQNIDSYEKNRLKIKEYSNRYYQENKELRKKKAREKYARTKKMVTELLGGKCMRCGFEDKRVLQVDHINGGGSKHFKVKGSAYTTYAEMVGSIKNKEKLYQLLCANCNLVEAFEKGYKTTIWK